MKKLHTLIMILCLFCCSFASAQQTVVEVSEDTVLRLDDFTLNLSAGMYYVTQPRETSGTVIIQLLPYSASGDSSSYISFLWNGSPFDSNIETMNASLDGFRESQTASYEASGATVNTLDYGTVSECTIAGIPGASFDSLIQYSYQETDYEVYQRYIYAGTSGYVIALSANDTNTLDALSELIDSILSWN